MFPEAGGDILRDGVSGEAPHSAGPLRSLLEDRRSRKRSFEETEDPFGFRETFTIGVYHDPIDLTVPR